MKKLAALVAVVMMVATLAIGCQAATKPIYGMVTDAGTIDDKSFNQGTWEGLVKAGKEFNFTPKYLRPANAQPAKADYLKEITNLYDAGYKFQVLPGFKFQSAVLEAQDKYTDAKFVCIDYTPTSDDYTVSKVGPNTVAIFYAEHEAGFVAGVATALQLKEGEVGFIGGMQIPPVQKFNWGFQQGIKYANEKLGTNCTMTEEHVIYQGTFTDVAAGQQIAATMYDAGVKAIFCAAGGVGVGAINEAKARATAGKEAWIIGVDVDQYADGFYDDAKTKSIILTSAMKGVTLAAYEMIKADIQGKFPAGQTLTYNIKNNGVGIPEKNPNLVKEVTDKIATVVADMKADKITVADKPDGLIEPAAK